MTGSERRAVVGTLVSIAIGAAVAVAGSQGGATAAGWPIFALCAALSFAINWTVFVPSFMKQTEHYFDHPVDRRRATGATDTHRLAVRDASVAAVRVPAPQPRQRHPAAGSPGRGEMGQRPRLPRISGPHAGALLAAAPVGVVPTSQWSTPGHQALWPSPWVGSSRSCCAFIVYESTIDDARTTNAFALMTSLNMLIETPGGLDYTGADCAAWMTEAGFSSTRVEHLVGPDSMVIGIK